MSKSWDLLRKRLIKALEPHGAVSEFCRKGHFSRNGVDRWLKNESAPNIENLDAIADALGFPAWQLIQPDNIVISHLNEEIERLHKWAVEMSTIGEKYKKQVEDIKSSYSISSHAEKLAPISPTYDEIGQMILKLDPKYRENFLKDTHQVLSLMLEKARKKDVG